ncbi:hypothetical protein [Dactylosporangium sp. CS-033363]|uniref:hypothetical protein n=1 Tax=Dactylosporangium sp. CS-033363 TaxID=3239935 RepID=UPI003D915F9D
MNAWEIDSRGADAGVRAVERVRAYRKFAAEARERARQSALEAQDHADRGAAAWQFAERAADRLRTRDASLRGAFPAPAVRVTR